MPVEVRLPQLGESIYEGTIARWLKQPGDWIEKYEPLVEITTDKVNVEMPSPFEGTLTALLVPEGETRPVGTAIALIETAVVPAAAVEAVPGAGRRLSPLVRRLAEEHRIPTEVLETLPGTGAGGRLTREDLLRYLAAQAPAASAPAPPPGEAAAPPPGEAAALPPAEAAAGDELLRLTPVRRTIAQRMAQSKREIPHAYAVIEVDVAAVAAWREARKEAWRRHGVPLTYTAFFVRAAAVALRAVPIVNSSWADEGIVLRGAIHIGVGIAVEEGLVAPVIRHADRLGLPEIARALDDLGRRAREGRLTLDDVHGGTFTVTNPGVFGSIWSLPVIVPGQAAILATDAVVKRAVVRDDAIAIRPVMHLGLSFDHRIFDGAIAMRFLNQVKAHLEGFRDGG